MLPQSLLPATPTGADNGKLLVGFADKEEFAAQVKVGDGRRFAYAQVIIQYFQLHIIIPVFYI